MSASQRRKGHAFERTVAKAFRQVYGPNVRRGLSQTRSGCEVPDIDGLPFWVEAKHRQRCNVRGALAEAEFDATAAGVRDTRPPIAVCRDNGKPDLVAMYLNDFLNLLMGSLKQSKLSVEKENEGKEEAEVKSEG